MQREWKSRGVAALVITAITVSLTFVALSEDISRSIQHASYHVLVTEKGISEMESSGFNITMNFNQSDDRRNTTVRFSPIMRGGRGYRFHNVSWYGKVNSVGYLGLSSFSLTPSYLIRYGNKSRSFGLHVGGVGPGGDFSFSPVWYFSLNSTGREPLVVMGNWTLQTEIKAEDAGTFGISVELDLNVTHYNISWLKPYRDALFPLGALGIVCVLVIMKEWEEWANRHH
ncbi:MAG: hypothetical protein R6V83_00560 [Candidatus Thorarchaeota archaeon]